MRWDPATRLLYGLEGSRPRLAIPDHEPCSGSQNSTRYGTSLCSCSWVSGAGMLPGAGSSCVVRQLDGAVLSTIVMHLFGRLEHEMNFCR